MKKWIVIGILLLILNVLAIISFMKIGSSKKGENMNTINGIVSLSFSYSNGYMKNAYTRYEINCKSNCIVKIKPFGIPEEEMKEYELEDKTIKELEELFNENKVYEWDGYNKSNQNVLDGDSFSFRLEMKDGKTVNASGYMMWPKNYRNVRDGIKEKLDLYIKEGDFDAAYN